MTPAIKINKGKDITICNNIFEGFETAIEANSVTNLDVNGNIIIKEGNRGKLIAVLHELKSNTEDTDLIKNITVLEDEIKKPKGSFEKIKKYGKIILSKTTNVSFSFAISKLLKKLLGIQTSEHLIILHFAQTTLHSQSQ